MLAVDGSDSLVSAEREFIFCQVDTGTYHLRLQVVDKQSTVTQEIKIVVWEEQVAYSRYISTVYEYRPAPGQFVNELPQYEEGNTAADMAQKAQARIAGTNDQLITLGGFGGYVTFGFDHSVVNVRGQYDFKILGNAFYSVSSTNPKGGSCEPGIVEVSFDRNQNGLPDDTWYELAGSAYRHADTRHHYQITYYRPDEDHVAIPKKANRLPILPTFFGATTTDKAATFRKTHSTNRTIFRAGCPTPSLSLARVCPKTPSRQRATTGCSTLSIGATPTTTPTTPPTLSVSTSIGRSMLMEIRFICPASTLCASIPPRTKLAAG